MKFCIVMIVLDLTCFISEYDKFTFILDCGELRYYGEMEYSVTLQMKNVSKCYVLGYKNVDIDYEFS